MSSVSSHAPVIPPRESTEPAPLNDRIAWFRKAKLGIFIHWGIYSVNGIDESWSFFNQYLPRDLYMEQLRGFTAKNYDPKALVDLIHGCGARYVVVTTKHHDGVALWDTQANDLSTTKKTPAARDVLTPLVEEIRARGLKFGAYYSLMDWMHPDFPALNRYQSRGGRTKWNYRPEEHPERWDTCMQLNFKQYRELADLYHPDIWWFDGHWWFNEEEWRSEATAQLIFRNHPHALINDRLPGKGDYKTAEQGLPLERDPAPWEACMTINDSWGYQGADTNYKSVHDVICMLMDCLHLGGNLLLDIGPKPDGTLPHEQEQVLRGLGRWTSKHAMAIYETRAGIDLAYFHGPSTIGTADYLGSTHEILYLFVSGRPNGALRLKGFRSKILRSWVVGHGAKVAIRQDIDHMTPGIIYLTVPEEACDEEVTVLAVMVDGKIELQPLRTTAPATLLAAPGANTGE